MDRCAIETRRPMEQEDRVTAIGEWKFPTVCPSCNRNTAVPVGTSDLTLRVVTATITCSNCFHSWTQHAEQPPVIESRE